MDECFNIVSGESSLSLGHVRMSDGTINDLQQYMYTNIKSLDSTVSTQEMIYCHNLESAINSLYTVYIKKLM